MHPVFMKILYYNLSDTVLSRKASYSIHDKLLHHTNKKENTCKYRRFAFTLLLFPVSPRIVLAVKKCRWTLSDKKKPPTFVGGLVFALPIFPGSHPPSIVGVHVLNFCVRDGNRWTHMTINTNYVDALTSSLGSVVTHTGFEPMLTA